MRGFVLVLMASLSFGNVHAASASESFASPDPVPAEDYVIYDRVVHDKFLTSETKLVLVQRLTVGKLYPDQDGPTTPALLHEHDVFDGRLTTGLVREFVFNNRKPAKLEARFNFGVRVRFVSGDALEEEEVSLAPIPAAYREARPAQAPAVLDRLAFSRVGYTLRNDQALVYVENLRPDGTGAGFLMWLSGRGTEWTIEDTEVLWTVRPQEPPESP